MKKIISLVLTGVLALSSLGCFAAAEGEKETSDIQYHLELRTVEDAKKIGRPLAEKIENALVLFVKSPNAYVFGKVDRIDGQGGLNAFANGDENEILPENLGLTPEIVQDRAFLPVRFVTQSFGAEVEWKEEERAAHIAAEGKKLVFEPEKAEMKINGQSVALDAAPQIIRNRLYIPFRALAQALSYHVFWDDRGLIVISRESIFDETEDAALLDELVQSFYTYSSADVQHPYKRRFIEMHDYSDRDFLRKYTLTELQEQLGGGYTQAEADFVQSVKTTAALQKFLDTPSSSLRSDVLRFAACYIKTGDDFYARRAILSMYEQALWYQNVAKEISTRYATHLQMLFGQLYVVPRACSGAYDILYYSDQWNKLSAELGADVRAEVEGWFRASLRDAIAVFGGKYVQNTNGPLTMPAYFTAMILNDPDLLHELLYEFEDLLFSGYELHADGMWQEGTKSYLSDTIGMHTEGLPQFKYYADPLGYTDEKLGIQLHYNSGYEAFPLAEKAAELNRRLKFPNGKDIPMQDTYPQLNKDPNLELQEKFLSNIELYHFGHFALTHGDTQDAQQVHLAFYPAADGYPYSGAHHYHYANLPIILWGSGMEVLPDIGYVTPTTMIQNDLRLYPSFHNAGFIWNQGENYWSERGMFARPSLLAYDSGENHDKKVQLIEASVLGPDTAENKAEQKRRLLLMVETEGNRSYTLDLQRLKGGDAHENYLISGEDERMAFETDVSLTEHAGTVADLLANDKAGYQNGREYMRKPQTADGDKAFDFRWTGEESGTAVHVYMNGVSDSELFFSEYPAYREAHGHKEKENDYPGRHFYRRTKVTQGQTTRYAAVYETRKKEQTELVKGVDWQESTPGDAMSLAAVVDLGDCEDVIYISDDTQKRQAADLTVSGNVVVVRRNKQTKEVVWCYLYGEGSAEGNGFSQTGVADRKYRVYDAQGSLSDSSQNLLKIKGNLDDAAVPAGTWLKLIFPDRTGWGLKITKAEQSVIHTEQHPAFQVTETGSQMLFYPRVEKELEGRTRINLTDLLGNPLKLREMTQRTYKGDTWVQIKVPSFFENGK